MGIGQRLEAIDVSKLYGTFQALTKVNLVCEPGEFVTILGSSGSGKTTLLKVIAGFEESSDGKIEINGEDIAEKKAYERNIGMLFQNYALFPHMTIRENIQYPLKLRKMQKEERREKVKNIIEMVKLNGMENRLPKQLSGGQQQRVALARAIVYNPPLLLLDEPLGALDMNLRHDMQFEIKRITKELGITTISVTHDQEEAFAMSDKICIMSEGKVQQFASPEEIYEHPSNQFVAEFMGTTNIVKYRDISYEKVGETVHTSGISRIADKPLSFILPKACIQEKEKKAVFALRPESIHLAEPDQVYENEFVGAIEETVYRGDTVKGKANVNGKYLNLKLTVKEYRSLSDLSQVRFYFDPADATLIYD